MTATVRIGEIAQVKGGKRLPQSYSVLDYITDHPYIRVTDMMDDGINLGDIKYISNECHSSISRYIIDTSEIYVSIAGTIGRVGIIPECLNGSNLTENAAKITSISSDYSHRFIMYYLRSHYGKKQLVSLAGGTSQPKLALNKIESVLIPKLAIGSQRKIAEILSAHDDLIENNRRQIKLLEDSARLLYREWFVRLRFPGHEQVKVVEGVPEGWEKVPLSTIMDVNPNSLKKGYSGIIKYVDISSVSTGSIDSSTEYSFEDAPSRARRLVKHGDTIWSCVRPNLRAFSMVYQPEENLIVSTGFAVLRPKSVSSIEYLYCVTTTDDFVTYLSNVATGTSYPAVTQDDFSNAIILSPPDHLLSDFSRLTSTTFHTSASLKEMNKKLAAARDLLLPRLMSGELEV